MFVHPPSGSQDIFRFSQNTHTHPETSQRGDELRINTKGGQAYEEKVGVAVNEREIEINERRMPENGT